MNRLDFHIYPDDTRLQKGDVFVFMAPDLAALLLVVFFFGGYIVAKVFG